MCLLLMAAGPEDVGKVHMGSLTANAVQMLRDIQAVFGVRFKIRPVEEANKKRRMAVKEVDSEEAPAQGEELLLSCFGAAVRGAKKVG